MVETKKYFTDGWVKALPNETPAENAARRMGEAQAYLQSWNYVQAPTNAEDWAKSFLGRAREQEKFLRAQDDLRRAVQDESAAKRSSVE